ncbi:VTT domain-containing protein [Alloacidobacterium dinghuense]|uniref:VTT domain-containing protein n=1 Tax=Alloacidobacterium dinghuense TaxID=2763107 RepID=A0A7G8BJ69_9BACT|nr:VTT domain-containing protein [Alloacidobacterium dinghuense]QNI32589.1 VTT domain-containing protein [Alloacidobacterium dinghuense]
MGIFQTAAAAHRHLHRHTLPIPRWLIHLGVPGVFVVSVIDASVIPLPLPGSTDLLVLLLAARQSVSWLLVLAAVSGSVLGGYLTWSAGKRGGEAMLERYVPKRFRDPLSKWVKRHSVTSVATAAILPPPIPLLPFLLAAGALGVSRKQFIWSFSIARAARYGLIAWVGATYGRRVLRLWAQYLAGWADVILWVFLGLLIAAIVFGVWKYRHDQRHARVPVSAS